MDEYDKIKVLLNQYKPPEVSNTLASRIIEKSKKIKQKQTIWQLLTQLFREFKLPSPAYSLASLLIFGFLTGFSTTHTTQNDTTDGVEQILFEDNSNNGDLL